MTDNKTTDQSMVAIKVPIVYLLGLGGIAVSFAVSLLVQSTITAGNVKDMTAQIQELKLSQDKRDDRMSLISQSNIEVRSQMNDLQRQMTRLSEDILELRKQESYKENMKRWAPK